MSKSFANRVYFGRYELIQVHGQAFGREPIELLLDRDSLPNDEIAEITGWVGGALSREDTGDYEIGSRVSVKCHGPHAYRFTVQLQGDRWVSLGSTALDSAANPHWSNQIRNAWGMVDKEMEVDAQ